MALTTSKVFYANLGDKVALCYSITGDAGETTWTAPVGKIDAAWVQSATAANVDIGVTVATNVVTFTSAPAAASTYQVFVIGTA